MRKILIVVNTYYQLIIALQLKHTILKNDKVVLFISDRSNDAENISKNLKKSQYFYQVKYIETKYLTQKKSTREKMSNFAENVFVSKNRYKHFFDGIDDMFFDELISFNVDIMIYNFYAILYETNHNIMFSGLEEGILSYNAQYLDFPGSKEINKIRSLFRKKGINNAYGNFYCFFPELYRGSFNAVKIPLITENKEIIGELRNIFDIKDADLNYSQKYIYFSSVYDFEGGEPIREIDIVRQLVEEVGRDNLIVKIHPRDTRTIYKDEGILIDKNSTKPWEVIQLLGDFSDKTYLTATSSSVLAGSFLSMKPVKTFYMYRMCDISGNNSALVSVKNIEQLLTNPSMNTVFKGVKIASSIEDVK